MTQKYEKCLELITSKLNTKIYRN